MRLLRRLPGLSPTHRGKELSEHPTRSQLQWFMKLYISSGSGTPQDPLENVAREREVWAALVNPLATKKWMDGLMCDPFGAL